MVRKKKSKKEKGLKKRVISKKLLKPSKKLTIVIPKREPYSVLNEENKFFKGEFENEKRKMFFS